MRQILSSWSNVSTFAANYIFLITNSSLIYNKTFVPMIRFKTHWRWVHVLFLVFSSLTTYATNTVSPVSSLTDSVRLSASNLTTTVGSNISVEVKVDNFTDVNDFSIEMAWNPSLLAFQNISNMTGDIAGFGTANVDFSNTMTTGHVRIFWSGSGTSLVNQTPLFRLNFRVATFNAATTTVSFSGFNQFRTASGIKPHATSGGEIIINPITNCNSRSPALLCHLAPTLCPAEFPYCSRNNSTSVGTSPGNSVCFASTVDNNIWIAFVAETETIGFRFRPSNCIDRDGNQGQGIQAAILESDDCITFSATQPIIRSCYRDIRVGEEWVLDARNLIPGKTYYIMVDGYANNSVPVSCDFMISLEFGQVRGSNTPSVSVADMTGSSSSCPNQPNLTYSVPVQNNSIGYEWRIKNSTATIVSNTQNNRSINVNWGTQNDSVCVRVIGRCDTSGWTCKGVNIRAQIENTITVEKCAPDSIFFGDRWLKTGGTYRHIFTTASGCDSVVTLTLRDNPISNRTIDTSVCLGSEVRIGTQLFSVTGTYVVPLRSSKGCDSIITLNLTVIESAISVTRNNHLTCQTPTAILTASYSVKPTTAQVVFEWTNASGQIVGRNSTLTVTQAGTYTFKLAVTHNGVSCSQTQMITVTRSGAVPNKPDLRGANLACLGTNENYRINLPASGVTFNWTVSGATYTGSGTQINATWAANSQSAQICADAENGCGKSDSICINVAISKTPDPLSISGNAEMCPNTATSYSVPPNAAIENYNWTVTGGDILNGQGTSLITVNWGSGASGRVCMTSSNRCGVAQPTCYNVTIRNQLPDSVAITGSTLICSNDTSVFSIPSEPEMTYQWDRPTGGFIMSGQGTNTISVIWNLLAVGNRTISVTKINRCSLSRKMSLPVQVRNATLASPTITGARVACPQSKGLYTILADTTIRTYRWTVPIGASILRGGATNQIEVDWASSVGGNVCVEVTNSCNVRRTVCFGVEVRATLDSLPLTGPAIICQDSIASFEVQNDINALRYLWQPPAGASIISGAGTNKVNIRFTNSSGLVRVVPLGGCADGNPSSQFVTVKLRPAKPVAITGNTDLCEKTLGRFSISPVAEAIRYQWRVPVGTQILGDSMGLSINMALNTVLSGQVCVRAINDCGEGLWTCTDLNIILNPVTSAGNDTLVCGNRATLKGTTNANVHTWSIVSKPFGSIVSFADVFSKQTEVAVSKSGIHVFKLETATPMGCTTIDTVSLDFKELPTLALAAEDCNLEATEYRVRFNINGGSVPFTVQSAITGTMTSNSSFVSNPIPNNTPYGFTVRDQFGCVPSDSLTGIKNCPCYTASGTLRTDSLVICYNAQGRSVHLNDARLDGNDTYEFVLHDGTKSAIGAILQRNKTGIFGYDAATMQYNRNYYVAYIVGDSTTNGLVNRSSVCQATAMGIPILFKDELKAELTGDTTICNGSVAVLGFKINRAGGFDVIFNDEGRQRFLNGLVNGQAIRVNPSVSSTYSLLSVSDKHSCKATIIDSARVNLKTFPVANAGVDRSICVKNIELEAAENLQYRGRWTSLTTGVNIVSPTTARTLVDNLQNGKNTFIWTVSDTVCPNYFVRDTINIFLPLVPKANSFAILGYKNDTIKGNLNENAPLGTYSITRLSNPSSGRFDIFTAGGFSYIPEKDFIGIAKFRIMVCSDLCTAICDTGEVRILIKEREKDTIEADVVDIPNAITPNGDGKNDVLKIDGIETYPENEIVIFNRWGDILYRAKPYMNDWQGQAQNGQDLPEGTYYYVLRLNVSNSKILRGNMTILR
jgi:gliding motility-associated-like protein